MTLSELKQRAIAEFGPQFERATPESVQLFVARIHEELSPRLRRGAFTVTEDIADSYVDILRSFFRSALDMPPEDAAVLLWLTAFEWMFSSMP